MTVKNYNSPEIEVLTVTDCDIITTSPGAESPEVDLGYGRYEW